MKAKRRFAACTYSALFTCLLLFALVLLQNGRLARVGYFLAQRKTETVIIYIGLAVLGLAALVFGIAIFIFSLFGYGWSRLDGFTGGCTLVALWAMLQPLFFGGRGFLEGGVFDLLLLPILAVELPLPFFFCSVLADRLKHQVDSIYFWPFVLLLIICSVAGALFLPVVTLSGWLKGEAGIILLGAAVASALITLVGNLILKTSHDCALAKIRGSCAEAAALVHAMKSRFWYVRCQALQRLVERQAAEAEALALEALADGDFRVRFQAMNSLLELNPAAAPSWSTGVRADRNRLIRNFAREIGGMAI